jgi:hypothetical protein
MQAPLDIAGGSIDDNARLLREPIMHYVSK